MEEMGCSVCVCLGCWVHCGAEWSACICLQDYCTVLFSMLVSMLSAVPVFMDECAGTNVCMGGCYACSTLPIPPPLVMASVCWTGGEVNCLWVDVCAHVCAGHEAELLPHWGYARYAGCVCVCVRVHVCACMRVHVCTCMFCVTGSSSPDSVCLWRCFGVCRAGFSGSSVALSASREPGIPEVLWSSLSDCSRGLWGNTCGAVGTVISGTLSGFLLGLQEPLGLLLTFELSVWGCSFGGLQGSSYHFAPKFGLVQGSS